MGCLLCDCNNENNKNKHHEKIDLSILNTSRLTTIDEIIPSSSLDYSSKELLVFQ